MRSRSWRADTGPATAGRRGAARPAAGGRPPGTDRPDYDYAEGVQLRVYELAEGEPVVLEVPTADGAGSAGQFTVQRVGSRLEASTDADVSSWSLCWRGRDHPAQGQTLSIDLEDDAT